jgi:hypothetical protein
MRLRNAPSIVVRVTWESLEREPTIKRSPLLRGSAVAGAVAVVALAASLLAGCTPAARRQLANTVLDVEQLGCALLHDGESLPVLKVLCHLGDEYDEELRRVINAMAYARAARASKPDAGRATP